MDEQKDDNERLYCHRDQARVCAGDCVAFIPEVPNTADYINQSWAHCMELRAMHVTGKHLTIIANMLHRKYSSASDPGAAANNIRPPEVR